MQTALDGRPLTWLAEITGDAYKNVQRWVSGTTEPPLDFVPRFCRALNVSLDWLLTGEGSMHPTPVAEAQQMVEEIREIVMRPEQKRGITPLPPEAFPFIPQKGKADADQAGGSTKSSKAQS